MRGADPTSVEAVSTPNFATVPVLGFGRRPLSMPRTVAFFFAPLHSESHFYHWDQGRAVLPSHALRAVRSCYAVLRRVSDLEVIREGRFDALDADEVQNFLPRSARGRRRDVGRGVRSGAAGRRGAARGARGPVRGATGPRRRPRRRAARGRSIRCARWIPAKFFSRASRSEQVMETRIGAWALRGFMEMF